MIREDISKLNKNRSIFLKIGFIISLSFTILAFNYTVYDHKQPVQIEPVYVLDEDVAIIRTKHEKKPIPPPPSLDITEKIVEVDEPEFIEDPEPELIPEEIPVADDVKIVKVKPQPKAPSARPKPPVVIPPEPKEEDLVSHKIWKVVEYMPEFGDCSAATEKQERKMISDKNLLAFIYDNISYPALARENGIRGTVVVRFVIDENGAVLNQEILKDPGAGCGKEVLRILRKMPNWKPGKQGDRNVKVLYNLPVKFELQ